MKNIVGAKYRLRVNVLGNPVGTVGYVFNQYSDFDYPNETGIQIIFPNGEYDGFSVNEQDNFLEYLGYDLRYVNYQFKNVMQVTRDFRNGYWEWD